MIADLDETLRRLLIANIPVRNGEIDIKFDQPKREWSARLSKPTVNLFLYDIRENPHLRKQMFENVQANGRMSTELRTSFRIDCFFMITTWAAEAEDEHRLMGRVLQALFRYPTLPTDSLVGKLQNQRYEIGIQLARHDKLTNPAEVWSALDNEIRPTVGCIVTLEMQPWEEQSGPVVRTLTMRTHLGVNGGAKSVVSEMFNIAGTVFMGETPLGAVQIGLKNTGYNDITGTNGRFRLGAIQPGSYTLVAWPAEGDPVEKEITIPAPDGNYDVVLDD